MSELLFKLVKSMTTSEKIFFKRHAKMHASKESKNYLKIYDVIEKSKGFDKNTLPKHFKGTTIEKYLSSEVSYLKEKILISLFNFNMNRTKRNQIQKGILLVESLASKGFQKEALKKLKAIKLLALKHEEFTWVLRLIELEEILVFEEMGYRDNLKKLHQQREETISIIQNINNYNILRQEIREFQFSSNLINNDFEPLNDICDNPLMKSDKNCMSGKAKEHWFYIHVLTNYLKRDFNTGLNVSFEYVQFMNQNIHLFDNSKIIPALSNYIFHAALKSDKSHFDRGEKMLIALSGKKGDSMFFVKHILYIRNLEFAYYANDKLMTEKYLALCIELIDTYSEQYEEPQIQYLLMGIVRATIILKQYDKGIHYCNFWHQRGVSTYRNVQAKLFSIIVHFELNYLELVGAEIILLKKLEKKHIREKELIQCFCAFMNSIIRYPEQRETIIKKFQSRLKTISQNNAGYFDFLSFDYHKWSLELE